MVKASDRSWWCTRRWRCTKIIPEDYVVNPAEARGVDTGLGEKAHIEYCIAALGRICKLRGFVYERLMATIEAAFGEDQCPVSMMHGEKGHVAVSCVEGEGVIGAAVRRSPSPSWTSDISFPTPPRD